MKSFAVLALGLLAFAHHASGIDVVIEPLPPVGSEVTKSEDGVVQVNMDMPGTVILGHCKVEAMPENYIIVFRAQGMAAELGGGDVALVIYTVDTNAAAGRAYGGSNLGSSSFKWSHLKTTFLAKATRQYDRIILGVHCSTPCKVQLRDFKVQAMSRREYEEQMEARFKETGQRKEEAQRKLKSDQ